MKRRLTMLMLLAAVPVLLATVLLTGQRSFSLALEREKQRTQTEESILYSSLREELKALRYAQAAEAAGRLREAYRPQGAELLLLWNGEPLTGALPGETYRGLAAGQRAALLDTVSRPQRYAVAEPVTGQLTLVYIRDVSDLYALRRQLLRQALGVAALGSLLLALLARFVAGGFVRPIRRLAAAADALAQGDTNAPLPVERGDEIGALARRFAAMRGEVESREAALRRESEGRQQLLDALAHEMRTPLTVLLGNARLLQRPLPEAERVHIAEGTAREVRRLSELDAQLLKLTALRHDDIERESVPALPLLRETAERLADDWHPIEVTGEDCRWTGDAALLSLAADNLTKNALLASPPGQAITLMARRNGFTVIDHGQGMTEEQLARCRDPFWRADKARSRARGGLGLGLTLVARVAELHGGALTLTSAPGEGTRASVTIPLHADEDSFTGPVAQ